MIEAGANEVPEDDMFDAIMAGSRGDLKKLMRVHPGHQGRDRQAEVRVSSITTVDHDLFDKLER